ncbi:hypothetical protein [Dictyobacter aurantiacus]|uniref:Uncharacterized protein n=1 Tax=Dictyobacter aurantiacus TaxID=1936993 RepID=A0A401ZL21_9CHLR|nr:hypothetical protein [Dictyobacter aurantiacus]GCE07577.1 hypothetical protein KDAU_49060 [Dictyobacter aurantiacus]
MAAEQQSRPEVTSNDLYRDIGREITARLQLQNHILLAFVTVSSTVIAASLTQPDFNYLDVGVGFLALVTAALSAHQGVMMSTLRLHQKILLERANPNLYSTWHHLYTEKVSHQQHISDCIQLFLYLVLGIAALSAMSFPLSQFKWIFFWLSATCFSLSLICIIYGWKKCEQIDLQQPQQQNDCPP